MSAQAVARTHSGVYYPMYQHTEKTARKEIDFVVKILGLQPRAKVLDLGCGFGRHAIELAKRGFKAVGVDISQKLLKIARKKAKAARVKVKFYQKDISKLTFKNEFDAVIIMLNTFGLLSDRDNEKVLANTSRALKKSGRVFIDLRNPERLRTGEFYGKLKYVDKHKVRVYQIDHKVYTETAYDPTAKRVMGRRYFYQKKKRKEYIFVARLYTPAELKKLFLKYKLRLSAFFGGFSGKKYNKKSSPRFIVAGEKQ